MYPSFIPMATDAPVREDLSLLAYADLHERTELATTKALRAKVRYLAALFPSYSAWDLAEVIHGVIGNKNWTIDDVYIVLDGRSLSDPSRSTNEIPLASIQMVGASLMNGKTVEETAKIAGVASSTVFAIDEFLGIRQAIEDKLMDTAIAAAREGWTVSRLAEVCQVSRSRAGRLILKARGILKEIGEIQ